MSRVKGQKYSKEERKQIILRGALVIFCNMGYDGANIDSIAQHAKCSHGLVYYYFKNKHEIFLALVKEVQENHQEFALIEDNDTLPAKQVIGVILDNFLAFLEKVPLAYYYVQFSNVVKNACKQKKVVCESVADLLPYACVRALAVRGQAEGSVCNGDVDMIANLLIASLQGLALRKVVTFEQINEETCVMPTADMLLKLVLA